MQPIKTLVSNFINFVAAELSELDPNIKQASPLDDTVMQHPQLDEELAVQEDVGVPEIPDNFPATKSVEVAGRSFPLAVQPCQSRCLTLTTSVSTVETSRHSGLVGEKPKHPARIRPIFTRFLAIREKILGSDHPDLDQSLHALGMSFFHKERYHQAELALRRSLAIRERILGPNHPNVAESLAYLGMLYLQTGLYSVAEPLLDRSLAIRELVFGTDHPAVAENLSRLAAVFAATGRYDLALQFYTRSLAIYEKTIDLNRPMWQITKENLALLRSFQSHDA